MSHGLAHRNAMVFHGKTPWHGWGLAIGPDTARGTWQDLVALCADLGHLVVVEPLYRADGSIVTDAQLSVNGNTGRPHGTVGKSWTPIQTADAMAISERLVATGRATWETAASLDNGSRVFSCIKLSVTAEPIKGDTVETYILNCVGHDGYHSHTLCATGVRVVCANTERMALKGAHGRTLRVRHTKNADALMQDAHEIIDHATADALATAEIWTALGKASATEAQLRAYVRAVLPQLRSAAKAAEEKRAAELAAADGAATFAALLARPANIDAELSAQGVVDRTVSRVEDRIVELFESGAGTEIPGVRGSAWGAYNAMTEYLTHERGKDPGLRFLAAATDDVSARAIDVAQKMFLG